MKIAAIDVGTNSVHLIVGEVSPDGRIAVIDKQREQVELGRGEFEAHRLTPEAMTRGVEALKRFAVACASYEVEDVNAAATSAVREAENGGDFVRIVKEQTGLHIRVISGMDEARLVYLGARAAVDFATGRALLFDLGGGSSEFVLCDAERALVLDSLPLGHIRLTERFVKSDPIAEPDRRALKTHVQQLLQPLATRVRSSDFRTLVGTSGTIRALARVATLMRGDPPPVHEHGLLLHRSELDAIVREIRARPSAAWSLPGLDDKRRSTLPAGAVLVREVMKALSKDTILTSERGLRDGLLVDWILHHRPELDLSRSVPDPRRRSILAMMGHYGVDRGHAEQVARFALQLFDATAPLHGLGADDRRLLELAALVHDVGHHIAGKDHHRHGQYLIRHTRMPGFTAPDIAILGTIVRYHRGRPKSRDIEFSAFDPRDRRRIKLLSGMLRVADALDRGHDQNVVRLDVTPTDERIIVSASTREPSDLERWAAVQRVAALEELLGRPIIIEMSREPTARTPGADEATPAASSLHPHTPRG